MQYKRKLVQPTLTAALFCGHKDNDLEDNFIGTSCSLNKRTGATAKAVTFPAVSQCEFHPLEFWSQIKSNQKVLRYPHNRLANIAPIGASYLASQYCYAHCSQLTSTVDNSPPSACTMQSTKSRASQQEGKLQIYHIFLILLSIDIEVHLIICPL